MKLKQLTSERIKTLSFLSIILVVYLHSYNITPKTPPNYLNSFLQNLLTNGLTRSAVPLFFTISGFLFFFNFSPTPANFLAKLKKRLFTLLTPYLTWKITILFLIFSFRSLGYLQSAHLGFLQDYSLKHFIDYLYNDPFLYQLWFIRDLMLFVLLSPLFYLFLRYLGWLGISSIALLWFLDIRIPNFGLQGMLFFLLGSFVALKEWNLNKAWPYAKILVLIWFALALWGAYLMTFQGYGYDNDLYKTFAHKGMVFLGVFALWFLADGFTKLLKGCCLYFLTTYTFFIYAGHEPLASKFIKPFLVKLLGIGKWTPLLEYLLAPILTITLVVVIGIFLKRYLSWYYRFLTGGR